MFSEIAAPTSTTQSATKKTIAFCRLVTLSIVGQRLLTFDL